MTVRLYLKLSEEAFRELVGAAVDADTGSREYAAQLIERWAHRRRRHRPRASPPWAAMAVDAPALRRIINERLLLGLPATETP